MLAACRRAALAWSRLLADSLRLDLYQQPELDIVAYFPLTAGHRGAQPVGIDQASARLLAAGMAPPGGPLYVSTLRVSAERSRGGTRRCGPTPTGRGSCAAC